MAIHPWTTIATCVGEGGIELGLRLAGIETRPVCYVEWEAYAAANLARLIEAQSIPDAPVWSNVKTLCDPDFRAFMGAAMGGKRLDLITGGYPCQPFSNAGRQRGVDDPRHLWPHLARALELYQPRVCFFENVAAHLRLGYPEVREELEGLGYRVQEGIFSAGEVGAGHRRERLFILAVRRDELADAKGGRQDSRQEANRIRYRQVPTREHGGELADTASSGTQGVRASGFAEPAIPTGQEVFGRDGGGVFPPGPADAERWARILAERPDLAPAIESGVRRVVDGVPVGLDAYRSHRLRLHGNAVVPLVASYAWVFLWADMLDGRTA